MRCIIKTGLFYFCFCGLLLNYCVAQNITKPGNNILIKIAGQKPAIFINALCNNPRQSWPGMVEKFSITNIRRASLLVDDANMARWVQISYADENDSLPLAAFLKKQPFIECIQKIPTQLLPCGLNAGKSITVSNPADTSIPWYITRTQIPTLWGLPKKRDVKVAVVDDAVRATHRDLAGHIWVNPNEIAGNNKDDDGDGFVDDIHGWDISDNDNDMSPPENRLTDFYHGTHLAGEIALATPRIPGEKFGVYIMPVKCLSDNAKFTSLKDGYHGVEYAIKAGADIINCSWGGGAYSQYEKDLLLAAANKNILVIASVGNFPTEQVQYPAGEKNAIGVTALDTSNTKPHEYNYGPFVSISAPGTDIIGASAMDDTSRVLYSGTSFSTPVVSAAAALLMACYPDLKAQDVKVLLMNSAMPVDKINPIYSGKLGAGLLNAARAAKLAQSQQVLAPGQNKVVATNAKGYLLFNRKSNPTVKTVSWLIQPYGHYRGMRVYMPSSFTNSKGSLKLYKTAVADSNLLHNYDLQQLPDSTFAPLDSLWVVLQADKLQKDFNLVIPYQAETVDSSCLYCTGTKVFTAPTGSFSDGSKEANYAGREDCKWLIEAPPGKHITLEFSSFDTEPRVDFLYVFDGEATNAKIIALYSGPNIPPPVTSFGNKMLIWFTTAETNHGKGWEATYTIE